MSVQRHVCPLQCKPEPPTASQGKNEPSRRIASASWEGLLRIVKVSFAVFCIRSWRCTYRNSSRICGTEKSLAVLRIPPRSRATTFSPASVNSFASMPPVQPKPTMTTSTSFILVAMSSSVSAHVRDAERIRDVFLVAKLLDVLIVHGDHSGEADDLPARLVAVTAIDRVGKHAFHHGLIHRGEENARGRSVFESNLAGLETQEKLFALALGDLVETLAVGLDAERVGGRNAGAIQLRGRERKLIALARQAQLPRALHVEALPFAPATGKRAIDIDVDADVSALGRQRVGRHHVVDQRLDKSLLFEIEIGVGCARRRLRRCGYTLLGRRRCPLLSWCRYGLLRWRRVRLRDYHRNSTACHGAFQKSSAIEHIVLHCSSLY